MAIALQLLTVTLVAWIAYLAVRVVAVLAEPAHGDPIEAALRHHHDQEEEGDDQDQRFI